MIRSKKGQEIRFLVAAVIVIVMIIISILLIKGWGNKGSGLLGSIADIFG